MLFKSYEHFYKLTTHGRTYLHSDYSADPRVVQESQSNLSANTRVMKHSADQRVVLFQSNEQTKGNAT